MLHSNIEVKKYIIKATLCLPVAMLANRTSLIQLTMKRAHMFNYICLTVF